MNLKVWIPLLLLLALVTGVALGWITKGSVQAKTPATSTVVPLPPSDSVLLLSPNGNSLVAKLTLNDAEDRLHLLRVENRRWLGSNVLTMIREKKKLGEFPELALDDEADNPLMHNMNLATVVVTNTGVHPVLLVKGPGYMFQRKANFTRCHEIFVTRDGVPYTNRGLMGERPEYIRMPYPDLQASRTVADESVLLYSKTSVKDPFWLLGPQFLFDPKTPATYRIKGRVTVCLMPKFEQVVLDTDEIEVTVTAEHIRQYNSRQIPRPE